ncbi:MAG: histidine kinase [Bacteroidetes bacterium]|nr:histidine kinase [Bacteroidota bacterium]
MESICQGDKNDMWIATLGGGVCHLDIRSGKTEFLTTAHGLSNNTVYSILKDKKGNLWITTNQGISRYNPSTQKFRNFGYQDGLKINEFNSDALFLAKDGEMIFGGMGGIVSFYPDSLDERFASGNRENLTITELYVSGLRRYLAEPVYLLDTLFLQKGDDNIQLGFSLLNAYHSDNTKYRYRIKGLYDTWIETDSKNRKISLAHLNPGLYSVELEATNALGDWVNKQRLAVIIPPFLYQTVWFRIFLFITVLLFILSLLFVYFRQVKLRNRQIQHQLKLETLRGQMNPHFIFNSLNSINYFISRNDQLSANRYIADFSKLIRSILENMSGEFIPLRRELDSIEDYLRLEYLRFSDKFEYTLEVDENLD